METHTVPGTKFGGSVEESGYMNEQEAWELDELLTRTTPEVDPSVQGPFIKHRTMVVALDQLSAT